MNENQYVGRGVLCISWQGPEERVSFEDRDHTELWGGFTSGKYGSDSGISLAQRQVLHAHIPNKYEEKMVRPKHIKFPLPLYPCGGGSQGRRERWKPLFSSWEKEMHATERGWNQHFSFSFPTKKKEKILILTWKFDEQICSLAWVDMYISNAFTVITERISSSWTIKTKHWGN